MLSKYLKYKQKYLEIKHINQNGSGELRKYTVSNSIKLDPSRSYFDNIYDKGYDYIKQTYKDFALTILEKFNHILIGDYHGNIEPIICLRAIIREITNPSEYILLLEMLDNDIIIEPYTEVIDENIINKGWMNFSPYSKRFYINIIKEVSKKGIKIIGCYGYDDRYIKTNIYVSDLILKMDKQKLKTLVFIGRSHISYRYNEIEKGIGYLLNRMSIKFFTSIIPLIFLPSDEKILFFYKIKLEADQKLHIFTFNNKIERPMWLYDYYIYYD